MKLDWAPVRFELKHWRREKRPLPIWWRDDDAIEPNEHLDQLQALSDAVQVPVHLAVIPRDARPSLGDYVERSSVFVPVVHGWSHSNHQAEQMPKSEFGLARSLIDRCDEAGEGLRVIQRLFGERSRAMFVPPWNRAADDLVAELPKLGFTAISTCNPRIRRHAVPGLTQINTHIDPLYWRPARRLSEPDLLVDKTMRLLRKRRRGKCDATEPFGLLTHHLAHFPEVWEFCRQFWLELREAEVEIFSMDQLDAKAKASS